MINSVIIDDEPLARECMINYIDEVDFLELAGVGTNPLDLVQLLNKQAIDLIFLDIQMPVMSGIDFLKMARNPPMVIITTAYPSYALEGFQLDVMDYLVKPIAFSRFFNAVQKAQDYHQLLNKVSVIENVSSLPVEDYFFIKCDYRFERIYFRDVLYIEAMQNYVTIFTAKGKYITLLSMKNVEQNLDPRSFMRVHKSYIVSISRIEAIENNEIIIQSAHIPVSRLFRDQVIEKVVHDRLWKKN
jgi:DNA-binding LytR/AlgR family response regulator